MDSSSLEQPTTKGPAFLLPAHHREIEAACAALRTSAFTDDPSDVTSRYRALERAVVEHMKAEEDCILPSYAAHAPADAAAIRTTHDELRRQLERLGIDAELHTIRLEAIDGLVATLRAHAAHEDREMYPWAQTSLTAVTKRELFRRIARSLRALARLTTLRDARPSKQSHA